MSIDAGGPLPGAWEWHVATDQIVLSRWLARDRGLAPVERVTSFTEMLARVDPADRERVESTLRQAAAQHAPAALTYRIVDGRGQVRTVRNAADVVSTEPTRMIGAVVDVPQEPVAANRDTDTFVEAVLEAVIDGLVACSRTGVPVVVNSAARRLYEDATGDVWDEHRGRVWIQRLLNSAPGREQVAAWRSPLGLALSGSPVDGVDVQVRGPSGSVRTVRLSARPMRIGDSAVVQGAVVTMRDLTDHLAVEERVARGATHDCATGLPNRRQLIERLRRDSAIDVSTLAILVVEVRGVGTLYESAGSEVADAALRAVATVLDAAARGAFVASLGDERFAVLMSTAEAEETAEALSRAVAALDVRRQDGAVPVRLDVHIGIAEAAGGAAADAAVREAEAAAQQAHDWGARVVSQSAERQLARALHAAVERDELVLHYQPMFHLDSRQIVGVEALVRWIRPGHGFVAPADFIPVAERTGAISAVGEWVLAAALADAARWLHSGTAPPDFRMSVNVSAKQFDERFPHTVAKAIQTAGIPAGILRVEVTESALMRDVAVAARVLNQLREVGAAVAIDDFGTGYSSLAYLRDLPADELKLDRSFVSSLGTEHATALVGGIVSIAHALRLEAVAEGVETEQQLVALATVGCDAVQGFLLSRPLPARQVDQLLASPAARRAGGYATATDSTHTVLVADDAADVRMLAHMSLTTSGFRVVEAADGASALEVARSAGASVAVLDVDMPFMDGFTVCRELRADPRTRNCTIVILTATATSEDKVRAFSAGADDYIVKPFSPREFVSRVRTALQRRLEGPDA